MVFFAFPADEMGAAMTPAAGLVMFACGLLVAMTIIELWAAVQR